MSEKTGDMFDVPQMDGNWFEINFKKISWLIRNGQEEKAARIMYDVYKSGMKDAVATIVPNFAGFMAEIMKELIGNEDSFEKSFWMFSKDNPNNKRCGK